jgi:pyruvate kinase
VIQSSFLTPKNITDSFSYAAVARAHELGAAAVVILTKSGMAARMVARHRPRKKFIALTTDEKTYNQLALTYGCIPVRSLQFRTLASLTKTVKTTLVGRKLARKNDLVLIVAGLPFGKAGVTNLLMAERL